MVMKIAFGLGIEQVAAAFGIKTPKAKSWLCSVGDLHKGFQVCNIVYDAAQRALCEAWLDSSPTDSTDAGELRGWIIENASIDIHFATMVYFFVDGLLPSLLLNQKGLRLSNFSAWMGGGYLLVPLLFVRGHPNMAALSVWDRLSVCYRAPEPVKAQRQAFISVGHRKGFAKPMDENQEETNKRVKRGMGGGQEQDFKNAIATVDLVAATRSALFATCGRVDRERAGRSDAVFDSAVDSVFAFFLSKRTFVPVPSRNEIKSLDLTTTLLPGADLRAITATGMSRMSTFVLQLKSGVLVPKCPKDCSSMTQREATENTAAAAARAVKRVAKSARKKADAESLQFTAPASGS